VTQQNPPPLRSSSRNRSIGIAALVIGLVIGLVLGIFISVFFNLPSAFHTGNGVNNQVQVSGKIQETQTGSIYFYEIGQVGRTSPIVNSQYSVILVGGNSYYANVYDSNGNFLGYYSLYVPLGVTTFTANF
jgi:hypothetical protein